MLLNIPQLCYKVATKCHMGPCINGTKEAEHCMHYTRIESPAIGKGGQNGS